MHIIHFIDLSTPLDPSEVANLTKGHPKHYHPMSFKDYTQIVKRAKESLVQPAP
jgi:hypothetical protein